MKLTRILALLLSAALFIESFVPVSATNTVDSLEKETSDLQSEVSDLNDQLASLDQELDSLLAQIETVTVELTKTKESLANAKWEEQKQYEAMKLRIKYMYENGSHSFLEILLDSRSMAEFLNNAQYISAISQYDQKILDRLEENSNTIEEQEKALVEQEKELQLLKNALANKEILLNLELDSTSEQLTDVTNKLAVAKEEAKKAEAALKEQITPTPPANDNASNDSSNASDFTLSATASDIELFAALIECEAGSTNYEGMLAVASVVMNRVKNRYYPNTIRGVIFQSGQFTPVGSGKVERVLSRGVKSSCVQVVNDALAGKNNVGDCLNFRSASTGRPGLLIGGNVFF